MIERFKAWLKGLTPGERTAAAVLSCFAAVLLLAVIGILAERTQHAKEIYDLSRVPEKPASKPVERAESSPALDAGIAYLEARERRAAAREARLHDRRYIDPGEFVKTYRREPAFSERVAADTFTDCRQQEDFELADFILQDGIEKGTACKLRSGDEYEVCKVEGDFLQVFDPASGKEWWIAAKYVREVAD